MRLADHPRRSLTVALVATLSLGAGCGGGRKADEGPSATERADAVAATYERQLATYATAVGEAPAEELGTVLKRAPELPAASAASDRYALAQQKFERVTAMREELTRYRELDRKRAFSRYVKLYGLATDQFGRNVRAGTTLGGDLVDAIPDPPSDIRRVSRDSLQRKQDRGFQRLWAAEAKRSVASWGAYAKRVEKSPARDDLERSTRAAELTEIRASVDFFRRFSDHLKRFGPGSSQIPFYKTLTAQQDAYPVVALAPREYRRKLTRELTADLTAYRRTDASLEELPTVGDAYRKAILDGFISPNGKKKRGIGMVRQKVGERLWFLARARELEKTPEEPYQAARRALIAESLDDPRNSYSRLILLLEGLRANAVLDRADLARLRALKLWATELLDEPVPPLLEPARDAIRVRVEALPTTAADQDAIYDVDRELREQADGIEEELRRGGRAMDSPKKRRAMLASALDAARP